jgi:hypothetical protein
MRFEPLHSIAYFAPQSRQAFEEGGLRGFWRGYFAGRAAPLGQAGPALVTALFYGFAPGMVARALPSVWSLAAPSTVVEIRHRGAVRALAALGAEALGGAELGGAELAEVAGLAHRAVEAAECGGRALGAANASLPWPEEPLGVLWQASTTLRELRGDGHVAALLSAGLSGLDALVLRAGSDLDREVLQPARGWSDAEWDAAAAGLCRRGLVDSAGRITEDGAALLREVEAVTDRLAAQPWEAIGVPATARFADLVGPLARAATAALPAFIPIGLPGTGGR